LSLRILHLVDGGRAMAHGAAEYAPRSADDDVARAAACVRDLAPGRHTVCFLGPAWARRRAVSRGLRIDAAISPPLSRTPLARRTLRLLIDRIGPFDLVQAWSSDGVGLARRVFGPGTPIVWASLAGEHTEVLRRWSRAAAAAETDGPADAIVACAEGSWRPRVISAPPPVPICQTDPLLRARVREEFRVEDDQAAVLLLGDAPHASASRFAFALGLACYAGDRVVGIVPAAAADLPRARRLHHKLAREVRLVSSSRPRAQLLAGSDLAVWEGGGPAPGWVADEQPLPAIVPIAEALAAGVPVVAPNWEMLRDLFAPAARVECLGLTATSPEIARKLIPLIEHHRRALELGAACRAHLACVDPQRAFVQRTLQAWQTASGPRALFRGGTPEAISA
jgi:hypothetical protein